MPHRRSLNFTRSRATLLSLALVPTLAACEDETTGPTVWPPDNPGATVGGNPTSGSGAIVAPVDSAASVAPAPSVEPGAGVSPEPGSSQAGPDPSGVAPSGPSAVEPGAARDCSGSEVLAPKRLVRLTFNQLNNSLERLFGSDLAESISESFELPSPYERTFPPLNNPREGSVIIDAQWQASDAIAQAAGQHVYDNFATVTGCSNDAPTEECVQTFVDTFVEQAFRRPLTDAERTGFHGLFSRLIETGAVPQEAAQYSVYAALSAPQFLYRTEFGHDTLAAGALTSYETASMLSYFITDGPPDTELLQAAGSGQLATPDEVAAQVERLLQTDEARENLQSAMYSYFGINTLNTIVIDPEVAPQFTEGLRASMMRETELFINHLLWNGSVQDLLTAKTSFVNQGLADVYGIEFPAADTTLDADGFGAVTLPDNRAGILTQPGYLTTRSSPEEPSVVRRGLLINASLLCATNPPFPEAQAEQIDEVIATQGELSEREKAAFRAATPECGACHNMFDAYGLGLDNFDVIGAYRTTDHEGRPIDATVTLPAAAGGATVRSPSEMAAEMVASGAFTKCIAKNLLSYALAEGSAITSSSCATKAVADGFAASDQSFSALVEEVARSTTFTNRSPGLEL